VQITKPGIYDIPAEEYHVDPVAGGSLSHGGAIQLLPPSCPAKYHYNRTHPEKPNGNFDIGRAAHDLVLRGVDAVEVIVADDWRTKVAQAARSRAYAMRKTPLLMAQWQAVQDMAGALHEHHVASALLRGGQPEQAIFWRGTQSSGGVWQRALLDFLPWRAHDAMYGVEYKSCRSAHPDSIAKAMWDHRYVQQAPWYLDALESQGLAEAATTPFFFIMQEKEPPYIITIAQLETAAMRWGRELNATAIDKYRHCVATNRWPGYEDDVVTVGLPTYAEYQLAEQDLEEINA
jgi:PDDEXK-like domain of unknown function (DUF3799)